MSDTPDSQTSEEAISPVVGVVLMVAITVALSGVVLVVVTGMGQNTNSAEYAAVDVSQKGYGITLQLTAAQTSPVLLKINGEVVHRWDKGQVGTTKTLQCLRKGTTVEVVTVSDGEQQVVQRHTVDEATSCSFQVTQGNQTFSVSPINWKNTDQSGTEFYNYSNSHSHMNTISERNTSFMFFYVYKDSLSMVVVHDKPNDSHTPGSDIGGGVTDWTFHNIPNGTWVEQDDGSEFDGCDGNPNKVCWAWGQTYTDGGVYDGGFSDDVNLTIENVWNRNASRWGDFPHDGGTMDKWQFLSRDSPNANVTRHNLTMGQNITIKGK